MTTFRDIFEAALNILGVPVGEEMNGDYAERAPFIEAAFCCEAGAADRDYRRAHGLSAQPEYNSLCALPSDPFPLCDRFVSAAVYYLAAMLVMSTDEELYDSLFAKYADALSGAVSETSAECEKIKDVYNFR